MPIPFRCPSCGCESLVDDQFAGHEGPCRQCGQPITVPSPAPVSDMQVAPAPDGYGPTCPRCNSQSTHPGPTPWYLGIVGLFFMSVEVCQQCGHEFDAHKPGADLPKRKLCLALLINGVGALGILIVVLLVVWFAMVTLR